MAMTQLHPTNARTMFPCMDEPQYKARFTLTVARRPDYTAVANMPLRATEPMYVERMLALPALLGVETYSQYFYSVLFLLVFEGDRKDVDPTSNRPKIHRFDVEPLS